MPLNNLGLDRNLPPTVADFSFNNSVQVSTVTVTETDAQKLSSAAKTKILAQEQVTVTVRKGDSPKDFELRALRMAARKAGLPLAERDKFAAANADGDFKFTVGDPTPKDDNRAKTKDFSLLVGKAVPYKLSADQIADLKGRVERYVADGGKLRGDKETAALAKKPNLPDGYSSKDGIERANAERAKLDRLLREAQVLPTSFGIPSKLTDLKPIAVTLPEGVAPTADNALSAYIEKRFGGGNLFGPDKRDILNNAKANGVRVENLKINPNNERVVSFNLSVESLLKLQKAYLDVQEKVNSDIDIADKTRQDAALNQFLVGVMEGAWDDVKGNVNTILHPLETLQGIRDAINVLSQLSAEDLKNIVSELGNKAANATPGEAAHAAGYVVGTIAVEAILTKGAGAALSALGKTKAGAAFLAKIGKLGELVNVGKAKVLETFSDEAASLAANRLRARLAATTLYAGLPADALADLAVVAANKVKNGVTDFTEFSKQMIQNFGEKVKPELRKLFDEAFEKVYGKRRTVETHDILGGHTYTKHIGKSVAWLRQRLIREPDIPFASSFKNADVANRAEMKFVKQFEKEAGTWAKNEDIKDWNFERTFDVGEETGVVVGRGKKSSVQATTKVTVRLVKDTTERGWHIITCFPSTK